MNIVNINGHSIGGSSNVFIIAEAGINHNGDIAKAFELIKAAKRSGANAVKFQTYLTEKRVSKDAPIFDLLKKCELSYSDQEKLFDYGKELGITVFSTPFDIESVDFLESIGACVYKIASFDSVNKELIAHIASKSIPVILSTGMTNPEELESALGELKGVSTIILHCVSSYPLERHNANLGVINMLQHTYKHPIGYSDHSIGIEVPGYAVAMGAKVIEKHFTLDIDDEGPDHCISADSKTMKEMIDLIRDIELIIGDSKMGIRECEKPIVQYRRKV